MVDQHDTRPEVKKPSAGSDRSSNMAVKGKRVVHCHGKKKGKTIKTHKTHAAAVKHHRAIQANKHKSRKKKG